MKAKKQRIFTGHRASLQSMDHVALGVIPKYRPSSGYWNPALDHTDELVCLGSKFPLAASLLKGAFQTCLLKKKHTTLPVI